MWRYQKPRALTISSGSCEIQSRAVFVGNEALLDIVCAAASQLPNLGVVILLHGVAVPDSSESELRFLTLLELEKLGRDSELEHEVDRRVDGYGPTT